MEQTHKMDEAGKLFVQLNPDNQRFMLKVVKSLKSVQDTLNLKAATYAKQEKHETSDYRNAKGGEREHERRGESSSSRIDR